MSVEKTIQSFMENLHITLSPDTQRRFEEAKFVLSVV